MEELLLEPLLAFHELDVVDEQHVGVAVAALERRGRVGADGVDVLVQERLGRHVAHLVVGVVLVDVVPDGVQQVGLAQPGGAVDEERVVRPGRHFGHSQCCRERELVGCALHERVEQVVRVEAVEQAGRVGRPDGRGVVLDGLALVGRVVPRLDVELQVAGTDFGERVTHERHVARVDPLPHDRVRHEQHEPVTDDLVDADVLERGAPDPFRHLVAEPRRRFCPQLLGFVHQRLRQPRSSNVHSAVHILWTTFARRSDLLRPRDLRP